MPIEFQLLAVALLLSFGGFLLVVSWSKGLMLERLAKFDRPDRDDDLNPEGWPPPRIWTLTVNADRHMPAAIKHKALAGD